MTSSSFLSNVDPKGISLSVREIHGGPATFSPHKRRLSSGRESLIRDTLRMSSVCGIQLKANPTNGVRLEHSG